MTKIPVTFESEASFVPVHDAAGEALRHGSTEVPLMLPAHVPDQVTIPADLATAEARFGEDYGVDPDKVTAAVAAANTPEQASTKKNRVMVGAAALLLTGALALSSSSDYRDEVKRAQPVDPANHINHVDIRP